VSRWQMHSAPGVPVADRHDLERASGPVMLRDGDVFAFSKDVFYQVVYALVIILAGSVRKRPSTIGSTDELTTQIILVPPKTNHRAYLRLCLARLQIYVAIVLQVDGEFITVIGASFRKLLRPA
jgi:hypothetical protein